MQNKEIDLLAPEQRIRENYASQISMSKHNCFVLICRSKLMCRLEWQFIECRSIRLFLFYHTQIPSRKGNVFTGVFLFAGICHIVGSSPGKGNVLHPSPRERSGKAPLLCSFKNPLPPRSDIWWSLLKHTRLAQAGGTHPTGMLSCGMMLLPV